MKTTKYFIYSLIFSLFSLLTACGTTTDPAEAYKGESAQQIFQGGETAIRDKDYKEAIKRFEALDAQYPFGRDAQIAQLHIIYAYYMTGDYASAEAAADRYVHAHPTDSGADYAYYMRGLSNYYQNMGVFERIFSVDFATRDLTQVKKSFNDFSELVTRFPDSRYAPPAHQYMVYLRNVLAAHQMGVARYYYDHQAYVASANRASMVVQYYQGAPVVPDALVMMAKSYEHLQMTALQNQTIAVIRYNYPGSVYLQEVTGEKAVPPAVTAAPPVQPVVVTPAPVMHAAPAEVIGQTSSNQQVYPGNGMRGMQPMSVSNAFHSLSDSFTSHSKPPVAPAPQNPAELAPPQSSRANTVSRPASVAVSQKPAAAEVAAPQQQVATDSQARGSHPIGLGDLLSSLSDSPLFSLHKKSKDAAATTPSQLSAQDQQLADADAQPAKNDYPAFHSNGTR
ncbi:MAG: outer membrane protein assembly factor BamD [Gammaproteobacteria bacterium]|nr:outer membrane protein assembly factor BamD [Gammaproteobacteria bacterium]